MEKSSSKKSLTKNYIYNLLCQLINVITPFITTPYISRILQSDGLGQYAFAFSISSYFSLFASLGFQYYAQREIARKQDDKKAQTIIFWEIFIARLIPVTISLVAYIGLILSNALFDYNFLLWILILQVASVGIDITYYFQGNEEFNIILYRSSSIKIIGIILTFVFVKTQDDLWKYTLCQVGTLFVSFFTLWLMMPKRLCKVSIKDLHIKQHFIPSLLLFIPAVAVSVYTMVDRTFIGLLIKDTVEICDSSGTCVTKKVADIENGYYEQSEKVVRLTLTIVTSLAAIMIPRNSKVLSDGDEESFRENIHKAIVVALFIGLPVMLGLFAISSNFSPWFFGEGYEKVPTLIKIFSPIIVIIGLSNVLALQYLIPKKMDVKYTICVVSGALVNITLNVCLIIPLLSYGAAIASVVAELFVLVMCYIFCRKDIKILKILKDSYKYVIAAGIMFAGVFVTQLFIPSSVLWSIVLVIEGVAIYVVSLLLFRDKLMFGFLSRIKGIFVRRKKNEQ